MHSRIYLIAILVATVIVGCESIPQTSTYSRLRSAEQAEAAGKTGDAIRHFKAVLAIPKHVAIAEQLAIEQSMDGPFAEVQRAAIMGADPTPAGRAAGIVAQEREYALHALARNLNNAGRFDEVLLTFEKYADEKAFEGALCGSGGEGSYWFEVYRAKAGLGLDAEATEALLRANAVGGNANWLDKLSDQFTRQGLVDYATLIRGFKERYLDLAVTWKSSSTEHVRAACKAIHARGGSWDLNNCECYDAEARASLELVDVFKAGLAAAVSEGYGSFAGALREGMVCAEKEAQYGSKMMKYHCGVAK